MRGFRKEAIERLNLQADGMEFASEMVIRTAQRRLRIAETPIAYYPSPLGQGPHLHSFRDGWRRLRFMLIWCPKYLFFFPGAAAPRWTGAGGALVMGNVRSSSAFGWGSPPPCLAAP